MLVTGCSSDDADDDHETRSAGTTSGTTSTSPARPTGPSTNSPSASPPVAGVDSSASDHGLSSGSLTKPQEEYIEGRVPEGTDPAAVVEAGEEACYRLRYAKDVDPDAAVSALIVGQVPNAADAIPHLCPELAPELALAEKGFADGTFEVGAQRLAGETIVPGPYRAPQASTSCSWTATGPDGELLAESPPNSDDVTAATVGEDATGFTSRGCFAWIPTT